MSEPVIVSAFIDLKRDKNVKSLQEYLQYAKSLLNIDQKKIIFLEQHVIDQLDDVSDNTIIVPFHKSQLQFNFDKAELPLYANKDKDTKEYLQIQLNKTFWIIEASKLCDTSHFIWIDFGINHICKNPDYNNLKKVYNRIRIPGCIAPKENFITIDAPNWSFCGGLFGGDIYKIIFFHRLIIETVNKLLLKNKITWEVNIWKLIYDNRPELFDWYYADHNCEMINNY